MTQSASLVRGLILRSARRVWRSTMAWRNGTAWRDGTAWRARAALLPSTCLVLTTLLTTGFLTPATAATTAAIEWTRRTLETGGISLELPASWTLETTSDTRILLREYPAKDLIAALSVEVFPRTSSLRYWSTFHRENQILGVYPGCTIRNESERKVGDYDVLTFDVTKLGGPRTGYDLAQTIVAVQRHFVIVSLYYQQGRSSTYGKIIDHVVESLRLDQSGASVKRKATVLRPAAKNQIDWALSFSQAFAEARRRNVPVMIAFNMDNEWANDLIASDYYRDSKIVKQSRDMVCLIASVFDHGGKQRSGGERQECERFGRMICAEHRDIDVAAREKYIRSRKVIAPQHLFCAPDGRLLLRREWHLPKADLLQMMKRSVSALERLSAQESGLDLDQLLAQYRKAPDAAACHWILSDVLYSGRPELAGKFLDKLLAEKKSDDLLVLVDGIGYAGHPAGVPAAVKCLDHLSDDVRSHAAVALEQIRSPDAADAIKRRLSREKVELVRKNLVRALGACANEDERLAGILIARARRAGELERVNAIVALKDFPENDKVDSLLTGLLRDEAAARVRAAAAWTLGYLGKADALPLLEELQMTEGDGLARSVLDQAIGRIEGTLDWRFEYDEILENLAGDTIFRRDPVENKSAGVSDD